jgi:hypothetical protein
MRRGIQVDLLTGKNIELRDGVSEAFEMRQMRMEIECSYAMEQAEPIECSVDCTLVAPASPMVSGVLQPWFIPVQLRRLAASTRLNSCFFSLAQKQINQGLGSWT